MKKIFIREDDAGQESEKFIRFVNLVKEENLPVTYAAIPGLLKPIEIDLIKEELSRGCNVVQHGLFHKPHSDKNEFKGRSYDDQLKDILEGKALMDKHFGSSHTNCFVPPWHSYDDETITAVKTSGFGLFSASIYNEVPSFHNFPVQFMVELPKFSNNEYKITLLKQLSSHIAQNDVTGVLLHHNELVSDEEFKSLKFFISSLKHIANIHGANFVTMEDLCLKH